MSVKEEALELAKDNPESMQKFKDETVELINHVLEKINIVLHESLSECSSSQQGAVLQTIAANLYAESIIRVACMMKKRFATIGEIKELYKDLEKGFLEQAGAMINIELKKLKHSS